MDELFSKLQRRNPDAATDGSGEDGLSALRLVDLPPPQRRIMRLVLREVEMSEAALLEAVGAWPEAERLSAEELATQLAALRQSRWLTLNETDAGPCYKVNLGRKAGNRGMSAIYETLDFEFKPKTPPRPPGAPEA